MTRSPAMPHVRRNTSMEYFDDIVDDDASEPRAVTEASLLDAATRLAGAERWGNVAVLEELLAPEYRGYDVSGQMHNRTSFLLAYAKGKMRLAALRLSQLETKVMGEVGLVAGVSEMCTGLGVGEARSPVPIPRRVHLELRWMAADRVAGYAVAPLRTIWTPVDVPGCCATSETIFKRVNICVPICVPTQPNLHDRGTTRHNWS